MGAAEALGGLLKDCLSDAVGDGMHVAVPEAEDGPALCFEERATASVMDGVGMLRAIQLHHQPGLPAREIGFVRADRQLAGESGTITRDQVPQRALFSCGLVPQGAGLLRVAKRNAAKFHYVSVPEERASRTHP